MEITCSCCKKKFEPSFNEDYYETQIEEGNSYNEEKISVRDDSCICPHCHISIRFSELSDYDKFQVQDKEMKRKMQDYEDSNSQEDDKDNEEE